jgi:hypothetical protein
MDGWMDGTWDITSRLLAGKRFICSRKGQIEEC